MRPLLDPRQITDFLAVCALIEEQGVTVTRACRTLGVSVALVRKLARGNSTLGALLAEAEENGLETLADALVDIFADPVHQQPSPHHARVISDNIQFILKSRKPDKYNERVKVDHTLTLPTAIINALERGRARAIDLKSSDVIDVTPELIPPPLPAKENPRG